MIGAIVDRASPLRRPKGEAGRPAVQPAKSRDPTSRQVSDRNVAVIQQSAYMTDKPEEAADFLSRAYVDIALRVPEDEGDFRLALDRLDAGPFLLDGVAIGARAAFGFEPDQEYFVSLVGRGELRVRQAGVDESFGAGDLVLLGRPGVESRTETVNFRESVVTLRARALRAAAGLEPEATLEPRMGVRAGSPEQARGWRRAVAFVAATLRDPAAGGSPLVVGATERLLAGLALAAFGAGEPAWLPRDDRDARCPATLRRAVAFIEANAARDIGIDAIAAAARVSRRAVQQSFRRHLGTTPTAYLRRVRLDAAHRELLEADPAEGLTVTEVAYRWGFCSPSRFTERYRAAFGTTPSATLRR
jgi:AraC-like DNA-binding protein